MKPATLWNRALFIACMVVMGAVAGAIVWVFLFIMDFMIGLVWVRLPASLNFVFLPLVICIIGGVIIGAYQKVFGAYPESLDTVLAKVKKEGRYDYSNFAVYSVAALLPLIFGGSVGPEAGLTGTIAGICSWIGDRMKRFGADFKHMTEIGVAAALSSVFTAPLFGVAAPLFGRTTAARKDREEPSRAQPPKSLSSEESTAHTESSSGLQATPSQDSGLELAKPWKMAVYLCAIAGAMTVFILLRDFTGVGGGLPSFSEIHFSVTELVWTLPLIIAGALAGWLYHIFDGITLRINERIGKKPILKCVIGGILLGGIGILLPYTMFAGESQATELHLIFSSLPIYILLLTGFIKLFITSYCIRSGWRGGHFFPAIFCGISIGLGVSALSGADPVFCMSACAGALLGCMTKQPLLTVLLLFLCFPIKGVLVMIIAAAIGAAVPVPKQFQQHLN